MDIYINIILLDDRFFKVQDRKDVLRATEDEALVIVLIVPFPVGDCSMVKSIKINL